jgi:crotonobetainyl-CoA:carnitine CoA-transferase CaiB-like acyl-CoA transferase
MPESPILHNIRILDFSWVLAGPYATRLLADFGAEVIKVQPLSAEPPDYYSRGYYNIWNRNKLGITLNLGKPEGIDLAKKLVKLSDAVVENFSPRVMANWGLDYLELQKLRPDIIMLSLSLMGQSGPWRDYSGFGPTAQAFSGITHLTAYTGQPSLGIGYSLGDHVSGLYGSLALLGALEYRHQTGLGQYIDLSQSEAMTSLLSDAILDYTQKGSESVPIGNSSSQSAPYGVYRCSGKDRWCAISATTDKEWEGFKAGLGKPGWADEERFTTLQNRLQNVEALDGLVQAWTIQHSAEEVMQLLQKQGVPAGIVQNAADLTRDPQLKERGFFVELGHPYLGRTVSDASPIRFSEKAAEYKRAAPSSGQDNEYIYEELLGLSRDEVKRLKEKGII